MSTPPGYGSAWFPSPPGPTGLYGYGGVSFGYGSGVFPRPPVPVTGGYGGAAYGLSSYGSVDIDPPHLVGARSIDGVTIELLFSEAMVSNAALNNPASYTVVPTLGAPVTVLSATPGSASTVLLSHTGTTLGGTYTVTVVGSLVDAVGNPVLPGGTAATFRSRGTAPTATVAPTDGTHVLVDVSEDLVSESVWSPGASSITSYTVTTGYPVVPILGEAVHPVGGDASKVLVQLAGMTSASYDLTVGPATSVDYVGGALPSAATGFQGVEVGTGTSAMVSGVLVLSKAFGATYGWAFEDTSGRVVPGCTFRADVEFNASIATVTPTLVNGTLATIAFADGAVQVSVAIARVAGIDVLDVTSGAYTAQVPVNWSSGVTTITVLRNALAGLFSVLVGGEPLVSTPDTSLTGIPTVAPGLSFTLGPACAVSGFPLRRVGLTASSTVFTTSWNFIHGLVSPFVGSAATARAKVRTQKGPLVRNWGDWTPATVEDVAVRVNGVLVAITSVNPYLGEITPTIPIPLTPPGTTTVVVDYAWFPTPAFPVAELNTGGLVLNKWDLPVGQQSGVGSPAPLPPGHAGVPDPMRFPYGVGLWPLTPPQPLQVGHRYLGFEREYSALTNSPTTLLLNQSPIAIARGDLEATPEPVLISYEGTRSPASEGWRLVGFDAGAPGTGSLYEQYVLVDSSADTPALYLQDIDTRFPSAIVAAAQVQVSGTYDPSGAMVGPVVGFHDDDRLYLAGLVLIDGMQHVGILTDAARPDLESSWEVGPSIPIEVLSATTFRTTGSLFAAAQVRGDTVRFRVPSGPQAGVYTVTGCGVEANRDGSFTVEVAPPFPADPLVFGASEAVAVVEVRWDAQPVSLRLVSNTATRDTVLYIGGAVPNSTVSVLGLSTSSEPASTYLTFPTQGGAAFWGSAARAGTSTSTSTWAYVRVAVQPDATTYHYRGSTVTVPTGTTPDVPLDGWFVEEAFGHGSVFLGRQVIERTAAVDGLAQVVFGYSRTEPFLTPQVVTDFDYTLSVDTSSATGGGQVEIEDGLRRVVAATVAYVEGGSPFRRLASVPTVSALCTRSPVADGWVVEADTAAVSYLDFRGIVVAAEAGQAVRWSRDLPLGVDGTTDTIGDAQFLTDAPGPVFRVPAGGRTVGLGVAAGPDRVVLLAGGVVVAAFAFPWNDGQPHRYRILTNLTADAVTVLVDGVVLGTAALSLFPTGDRRVSFGVDSGAGCQAVWFAAAAHPLFNSSVQRTLGIAAPQPGVDLNDINGWVLPRLDNTPVPNSSALATVLPMDWASEIRIRVRLDPQWGATLYRPDLPLPTGGPWATDTTRPSDGWINVEYARLPRATGSEFGRVSFGSLASGVLSTSRWGDLRYQIRTVNSTNFLAPQGMTLNRYNTISSGEMRWDTQPEVVTVPVSGRAVSLVPSNINAERVFTVAFGSTVLSASAWTFNAETQTVTLDADPPVGVVEATVTFVPGSPVTLTYLCSQPLHQSTTLLNEGTPPVPASQADPSTRVVEAGSAINDPGDILVDPGFTLNDPTQYVTFVDPAEERYDSLEFCEADNAGQKNLISTLCDGPAIGHGLAGIALSGTLFSEQRTADGGPARWGGSVPMRDTVLNYRQESVLLTHGGVALAGGAAVLNQNVVLPNYPSVPGPDRGAVIRATTMRMRVSSVLVDASSPVPVDAPLADVYGGASDNVPPSTVPEWAGAVVPDGVPAPSGNGACIAQVTDYATTTYSRLGPWGGLGALQPRSLLGGNGLPPSGVGLTLGGGVALGGAPTVTLVNVQAP